MVGNVATVVVLLVGGYRVLNPHLTTSAQFKITIKGDKDAASSFAKDLRQKVVSSKGEMFELEVKKGPVANDLMVNLKGGANPVLAHLFINYMLGINNALDNYSYVGYMQPLTAVTPSRLISEKLLPRQLTSTVVLPEYFRQGLFQLQLPPAANSLWESTWNTFSKGL